ncbi:MAG: prepilin-type N-terminal cleavage/methylation domain-containing protein [Ezakiella sp.]|nr:prepilin-type N-terminal cleavage/methylation domain-containing protein [Ezakiella sp.]MDD7471866.1 competence type IV pilus minor pilin ComGD [Bacillota bacterium]MDY3923830.1 competence type IV pilus minor pilin ComGD [Ezakiella sp.]
MKYSRNNRAFTLLEMIIVLLVISILSGIIVVGFNAYKKYEEKMSINDIVSKINFCRKKAIATNDEVTIELFSDNNIIITYFENGTKKVRTIKVSKTLEILTNNTFTFTKSGAPRLGGSIMIDGTNKGRYIITIVPATGKVNLYVNEKK